MNWYWFLWLAVGFGIPEGIAIARHRTEDTLSGTVWHWCDVAPGNTLAHWSALHLFLAFILLWLFLHLVFGIFR